MSTLGLTLQKERNTSTSDLALGEIVARRLAAVDMLPEFRQTLLRLAVADERWSAQCWLWGWVIPAVQATLGGIDLDIEPFAVAWTLMHAAIIRLDRLQDGDPNGELLPMVGNTAAQYNSLLSYYVLASSMLDNLSSDALSPQRISRLRRLWSDMMLRMASGQQCDLTIGDGSGVAELTAYQNLVRTKTGSAFALAFGGAATLLTDDQAIIDACLIVGDLFGALIQYYDDILDANTQPNVTLTLPDVLIRSHPEIAVSSRTPQAFWAYLYRAYRDYAERVLADLPNDIGPRIVALFVRAFESAPHKQGDAA